MRARARWGGRRVAVVAALTALAALVSGCTPTGPGALVQITDVPGDGTGPVVCQELPPVETLAVSSGGNVYFVSGQRIYKVAKGVLSVVAGTGAYGFSGDGGSAKAATFRSPHGLWIDSTGLYIADTSNNRVRKVTGSTGIITTIAGNGHTGRSSNSIATHALLEAPFSLWGNGSGGLDIGNRFGGAYLNLTTHALTATSTHSQQFAVDPSHNTYGFAASVAHPSADYPRASILRFPNHSTTGVPFAGNTTSGSDADGTPALDIYFPNVIHGLATDPAGNVYFTPNLGIPGAEGIKYIDPATHTLHTVGGFDGYEAVQAPIAVAPNGDLYAAVDNNSTILRRDHTTGHVSLVAGGIYLDTTTPACPNLPAADWTVGGLVTASTTDASGDVYVATDWQGLDHGTGLWELTAAGNVVELEHNIGGYSGDGGPIGSASFGYIDGLGLDGAGNLYVADKETASVRKVDHATGIVTTVAGLGTGPATPAGDGGPATSASLGTVRGLAVDAAGDLFIAERTGTDNGSIREVDASSNDIATIAGAATGGTTPTSAGTLADQAVVDPESLTLGTGGSLYYGTTTQAFRYDPPVSPATIGTVTRIAGTGSAATAVGQGDGGSALSAPLADETNRVVLHDGAGNVYLIGGLTVQRIDASTGVLHTLFVAAASRGTGMTDPANLLWAPTPVGADLDLAIGGVLAPSGTYSRSDPTSELYRLLGPATAPEDVTPR